MLSRYSPVFQASSLLIGISLLSLTIPVYGASLKAELASLTDNPSTPLTEFTPPSVPVKSQEKGGSGIVLKSGIAAFSHEIDLTVDKADIINLKTPVARVSISQSDVANVVIISPTQLQLVGKKVGATNMVLWDKKNTRDYTTINIIVHRDVSALAKQLQRIDPGIDIVPMAAEDSVILSGEVTSPESAQLAVELAKAFFSQNKGSTVAAIGSSNGNAGSEINSQAPGSATPRLAANVINLIKIKNQPSTKLALVRQKLYGIDPNIQLDIVPGPSGVEKAILTGRVARAGMVSKAINTASIFYGQPGLKVLTGPGGNLVRPTGSGSFQDENAFSDNMDINILQGSVVTDATGNVVSMMEVAQKPQVKCTIRFLDISRRDLNQLGATLTGTGGDVGFGSFSGAQSALKLFSDLGGTIGGSKTGSGFITGFSNGGNYTTGVNALAQTIGSGATQVFSLNQKLAVALSAFVEKKKIRSLAEPTLTMLSGEKASFLAGGEVPIPITGNNGQISVTFKEFGIRLNLVPTVTDDGRIHMQVAPEVSAVDPSKSITANGISIPGFRTRRMQSTLELEDRQTFVLAGLFSQEEMSSTSQFPGLGSIPVLGSFFRQKNGDQLDNEMLVIITPEIKMVPTGTAAAASPPADPATERKTLLDDKLLGIAHP